MNYPLLIVFIILYVTSILFIISKSNVDFKNIKLFKSIRIVVIILFILELTLEIIYNLTYSNYFTNRILVLVLILSGVYTFVTLKKDSFPLQKVYFGLYLVYPLFALLTFFLDRIMFVIVASPLIFSYMLPKVYFSDSNYEIRTFGGGLAYPRIELVEKFTITEKRLAITYLDYIKEREYSSFEILESSEDSLITLLSQDTVTFYKNLDKP